MGRASTPTAPTPFVGTQQTACTQPVGDADARSGDRRHAIADHIESGHVDQRVPFWVNRDAVPQTLELHETGSPPLDFAVWDTCIPARAGPFSVTFFGSTPSARS